MKYLPIRVSTTEILIFKKYKSLLDWSVVCNNDSFHIDNAIIELFSDYIDWSKASSSLDIKFTKAFVEKYKDRWNWSALAKIKHSTTRSISLIFRMVDILM